MPGIVMTTYRTQLVYAKDCTYCEHSAHSKGGCLGIDWGANGKEPWGCSCEHESEPYIRVEDNKPIPWRP